MCFFFSFYFGTNEMNRNQIAGFVLSTQYFFLSYLFYVIYCWYLRICGIFSSFVHWKRLDWTMLNLPQFSIKFKIFFLIRRHVWFAIISFQCIECLTVSAEIFHCTKLLTFVMTFALNKINLRNLLLKRMAPFSGSNEIKWYKKNL